MAITGPNEFHPTLATSLVCRISTSAALDLTFFLSGEQIHSKDYKSPKILEGKRVLVVGGGNSACDINVEAGRFSKKVHSSMRRGYWFLPRCVFGAPMGMCIA